MADYTIQPGDTLSQLAQRNNTTVQALQSANPNITDVNKIYAGANLKIPTAGSSNVSSINLGGAPSNGVIAPITSANQSAPVQIPTFTPPPQANAAVNKIASLTNNIQNPDEVPSSLLQSVIIPKIQGDEQKYNDLLTQYQNQPKFNQEQTLQDLYTQYGVPELFDQMKSNNDATVSIKTQIDTLTQQRDAQIAALTGRGEMSMDFLNNATAQINRNYNVAVAPLSASMASYQTQNSMLQNNITQAQNMAEHLVSAATYDSEQNAKNFQTFYDMNKDMIGTLNSDYKDALDAAKTEADNNYKQAVADRKEVAGYATNPKTAPALLGSDLSTISVQDARQKVNTYLNLHATLNPTTPNPTTPAPTKFTSTQENKGASNAGLPIADFQNFDSDTKNIFINNKAAVADDQKFVGEQLTAGTSKDSLKAGVDQMDRTDAYKQWLKDYIDKQSAPKTKTATPTKQWWEFWK